MVCCLLAKEVSAKYAIINRIMISPPSKIKPTFFLRRQSPMDRDLLLARSPASSQFAKQPSFEFTMEKYFHSNWANILLAPQGALVVVVFLDISNPIRPSGDRFECSQLFYVKLWSQVKPSGTLTHHQGITSWSTYPPTHIPTYLTYPPT